MEGDSNSNTLNITTLQKEVKKTNLLEFTNPYEKYVFKTIVYNHLVTYFLLNFIAIITAKI
jgi:hypothetical protein